MRHNTEHSPFVALDTVILSRLTPLQPTALDTTAQVDIVANTTLLKAAPKKPCRYKHVCFMCLEMHSARFCRLSTVSNDTPGLPTPVKIDKLLRWLEGYDNVKTKYLEIGFSGFRLGFNGVLNKKTASQFKIRFRFT